MIKEILEEFPIACLTLISVCLLMSNISPDNQHDILLAIVSGIMGYLSKQVRT